MTSPNSTFTELVTTTLREHPAEIADNISGNNALYRYLKTKNKIKTVDGGLTIVRPLDYAENATFQRFSGYDQLNIQASDVLTAAEYSWVQSCVNVTASGDELRKNSGGNQIVDLAKARIKNALRTAANNMSVDIYSSGSLSNQMGGLGSIISTAGTGTVGGIDSGTYTFWQNKYREISGTNAWSKTTLKGDMNALWMTLNRGTDKPDLLVSSHDFYAAYWEGLQDLQRFASADTTATAGFTALKYNTADIIFDSNSNFGTTAEKMYFLNTDYLELVQHRDAQWSQMDEKMSVNQDAVVIPLIWMGQLVTSWRAGQGILIDAA